LRVSPVQHTSEELAATAILHAEVQVVLGLKRMIQSNDEWVIAGCKDLLFSQCALDLVALYHLLLVEY